MNDQPRVTVVLHSDSILIRWLGLFVQTLLVVGAARFVSLDLPLVWTVCVILAGVVFNLVLTFKMRKSDRLSSRELTGHLMFDTVQITAYLFLTGGFMNPGFLYLLAPLAMAMSAREGEHMKLSIAAAVIASVFLVVFAAPLEFTASISSRVQVFATVAVFLGGLMIALVIAFRITQRDQVSQSALQATSLALEREKKLSDVGGVISATAHQLGAPLSTIMVSANDLVETFDTGEEGRREAKLIRAEAEKCQTILRSIGEIGQSEMTLFRMPITALLREASEPLEARGKPIRFFAKSSGKDTAAQPIVNRSAELVHAYRNLIENAVTHATSAVEVHVVWTERQITTEIRDDGPGFPDAMLDTKTAMRTPTRDSLESGGNMGLGLFIARALIERSGGTMTLSNKDGGGCVAILWPSSVICA